MDRDSSRFDEPIYTSTLLSSRSVQFVNSTTPSTRRNTKLFVQNRFKIDNQSLREILSFSFLLSHREHTIDKTHLTFQYQIRFVSREISTRQKLLSNTSSSYFRIDRFFACDRRIIIGAYIHPRGGRVNINRESVLDVSHQLWGTPRK